MTARTLRIGTRGSALARAQADLVASALAERGQPHEIVLIETDGDRRAPDTPWGEGAFVAAIERALLDGRVDVAVHSAKDVPTDEDPRLRIAAFLPRADPRDALVVAVGSSVDRIDALPPGSRVGTDSPRRAGFLAARRPDLDVRPLHGNVDTRLRRLDAGEVDALVLAVAGLERLGRADRVTQTIASDVIPPAPGQGAIAVQVRADDPDAETVAGLDHAPTRLAVEAERAFLRAAGGGCRAPIGALAEVDDGRITLLGGVAADDGTVAIDAVEDAIERFPRRAADLAARLGRRVPRSRRAPDGPRPARPPVERGGAEAPLVLVTRPADQAEPLVRRLRTLGLAARVVPAIAIAFEPPGGELDAQLRQLASFGWAVVTSANGARGVVAAASRLGVSLTDARWAAVGSSTGRVLLAAGVPDPWQPADPTGAGIGAALPVARGDRVLLVRGSIAEPSLPRVLQERGADVTEVVAYRTVEAPPASRDALARLLDGRRPDAVLFASGSAVRGTLALADLPRRARLLGIPAVSVGPRTTAVARAAGFTVLGEAGSPSADALAELTAALLAPSNLAIPTGDRR